ncbi:hypothetical protein FQN60_008639 [Etheostoma spectabile]|uniref:Probable proton-coupled zinc antiporter SLC30A3 n=1 Tax=Etheostoma spectabile TaxID=54343 RepID=A0A5J5CM53_9PERO|nr:hypothetical protein FQN60_008639 [Etheostoma spectabile]
MEASTDSEKQHLIETHLEALTWTSSPEDRYSESLSESSDGSSVDGQWPDQLCQDIDSMSAAENDHRRLARRKLFMACAVSLVFMIGELIEILGMLLSVVSIWAVTAVLVITAIQRITDGDYDINSQIMLLTSGCAVGANVLMVLILHQSGSSHGHSHSFPSSRLQTDRQHHGHGSVKAAFIHVVGDLPEYKAADPICTFVFSVFVLGTTLPVTKDVFVILMEGVPQGITFSTVRELLLSVRGVVGVHSLHMWSLNMTHSLLSVHVATEEDADSQIVLRKATKLLRSEFGFSSVTIQASWNMFLQEILALSLEQMRKEPPILRWREYVSSGGGVRRSLSITGMRLWMRLVVL